MAAGPGCSEHSTFGPCLEPDLYHPIVVGMFLKYMYQVHAEELFPNRESSFSELPSLCLDHPAACSPLRPTQRPEVRNVLLSCSGEGLQSSSNPLT